jgi:hypothetical protein
MLFDELSLHEYFYIHLNQSLLFLIIGPIHIQLKLYPMLLIQHFLHLVPVFLHQILCQYNQPIYAASYYSICILYCL